MSSSKPDTAIFLSDSPEVARQKIGSALTGGRGTVKEQRELGGNPDACKVFAMMKFHCPDDHKVEKIFNECRSGALICGDCKKLTADWVCEWLEKHQKKFKKAKATAEKIVG
jgi:tryptophanyl-tRNA synthetase